MLAPLFLACRDLWVPGWSVNSGRADGYYVELIGIKGLNWLSKHFINRDWAGLCERFIGGIDRLHLDEIKMRKKNVKLVGADTGQTEHDLVLIIVQCCYMFVSVLKISL